MRRSLLVIACLAVSACGPTDDTPVVAGDQPPSSTRYRVDAVTVLESPGHGPQLCRAVAESYPPQCGGPDVVGWDWADVENEESASGTTWGAYQVTGTWDGTRLTLTEPPVPPRAQKPDEGVELSTPCPEPAGGWQVVDDATATEEALSMAQQRANSLPGFAGLWIDQSINPASSQENPAEGAMNDPTKLILNVRLTDDLETAEAELRELWGGALCVSPAERSLAELQAIQTEVSGADVTMSSINQTANTVEVQVTVADPALQADYDARYGDGAVDVTGWLQPVE
ncbi:hypothetical protein BH24ACT1_BH24ACT1_11460 [soil metagenome]